MSKQEDAPIWSLYRTHADKWDDAQLKSWNDTLDVFLLFAALFSSVLSAFLISSYTALQPDPQQATLDALVRISAQLEGAANGMKVPSYVTENSFSPPAWALAVNALWFTALSISLGTAVFAMLVKQWLTAYKDGLPVTPQTWVRERHFRYVGMQKWKVPAIVSALPLGIHLAVALFLIGLVPFLWNISVQLAALLCGLLALFVLIYAAFSVLPSLSVNCPYRSPLSGTISGFFWALPETLRFIASFFQTHRLEHMPLYAEKTVMDLTAAAPNPVQIVVFWLNTQVQVLLNKLSWGTITTEQLKDENGLDLLALDWLSQVASDPLVTENTLLALVGWNPPKPVWEVVRIDVTTRATLLITQRLTRALKTDNTDAALDKHIGILAALSSLLGRDGYKLDRRTRSILLALAAGSSQTNAPDGALLACAFLLYAVGSSVMSFGRIHFAERRDLLELASNCLITNLQSTKISTLGGCLVLSFFRRYELYSNVPIVELSAFIASARNVPPEWLSSFLAVLEDFPHRVRVRIEAKEDALHRFTWNEDPRSMMIQIVERSRIVSYWAEEEFAIFKGLLQYIAYNPAFFDSVNGTLIDLLSTRITTEEEALRNVPSEDKSARISQHAMEVVTELMDRKLLDDNLPFSVAFKFLMFADKSNPALASACARVRALRDNLVGVLWKTTDLTRPALRLFTRHLRTVEDPRYFLSSWMAREYVNRHWHDEVVQSGWLGLMYARGLEIIFNGAHSAADLRVFEQVLGGLGLRCREDLRRSRVLLKLEALYGGREAIVIGGKIRREVLELIRAWYGDDVSVIRAQRELRIAAQMPLPVQSHDEDV